MNDVEIPFTERVAQLGCALAELPQQQCPVVHRFAPGVYVRELHLPADTVAIGKVHKTEHFNILLKGACLLVNEDGSHEELRAPMTFVSGAGVQKVVYILEDMIWQTVHVTQETDMEKLAAELVEPCEWAVPQSIMLECQKIAEERK